jgi:hypothetical protein
VKIQGGQAAKSTHNLIVYRKPETDAMARQNAIRQMAEVIADAGSFNLSLRDLTQGKEVPTRSANISPKRDRSTRSAGKLPTATSSRFRCASIPPVSLSPATDPKSFMAMATMAPPA